MKIKNRELSILACIDSASCDNTPIKMKNPEPIFSVQGEIQPLIWGGNQTGLRLEAIVFGVEKTVECERADTDIPFATICIFL